jgi:hypothetical protein
MHGSLVLPLNNNVDFKEIERLHLLFVLLLNARAYERKTQSIAPLLFEVLEKEEGLL